MGAGADMTRVTLGKSRVRESRLAGSVRAKPNGRAPRPLALQSAVLPNAYLIDSCLRSWWHWKGRIGSSPGIVEASI
ncbi:hypothetical protein DAA51_32990 [Bradyrhizobium sp. WBAH10]|nr:hypothetical protein [Bradyrhizobium sp. WBAH30]MDD1546013.1 hypothetical protein [Bradyrhizobium sp. WBAH41]MDD1559215.1 hypothetical protein [Bradyrhizobium sp. WBAH23]MDD1566731.1 hypothetical protein [Bradyrhizobium sp. WBAH33]MDD1592605.1 hypothetical protein [Bradyrhizobium sp. WBAH42]NRB90138.1 hypothetical protein [Bradyrhizobium sp. WBAH10]QCJ92810.1 hypothetical protein DAA57_33235 [Bradyrhizobium yuanmingense]